MVAQICAFFAQNFIYTPVLYAFLIWSLVGCRRLFKKIKDSPTDHIKKARTFWFSEMLLNTVLAIGSLGRAPENNTYWVFFVGYLICAVLSGGTLFINLALELKDSTSYYNRITEYIQSFNELVEELEEAEDDEDDKDNSNT